MASRAAVLELSVAPAFRDALASAGLATVAQVLEAAETVRDLPGRANLVLRLDGGVFHVKLEKGASASAEAAILRRAHEAGVPTATIAFEGADPSRGAIVGTVDLAPARPLDELLARGLLPAASRPALLRALARATGRLHDAGLHPRDLYLNHVFVPPGGRPSEVTLIDLERAAGRRWLRRRAVVRDLAALRASAPDALVPIGERRRFLARYLRARGLDVRAGFASLEKAVERKAAAIRAHAPRTPVGDAARPSPARP